MADQGAGPDIRRIEHDQAREKAAKRQATLEDIHLIVEAIGAGRRKSGGRHVGQGLDAIALDQPRGQIAARRARLRRSPAARRPRGRPALRCRRCAVRSAGAGSAARRPGSRAPRAVPGAADARPRTRSPDRRRQRRATRRRSPRDRRAPRRLDRLPGAMSTSWPSWHAPFRRATACRHRLAQSAARRRAPTTGRTGHRNGIAAVQDKAGQELEPTELRLFPALAEKVSGCARMPAAPRPARGLTADEQEQEHENRQEATRPWSRHQFRPTAWTAAELPAANQRARPA